MQLDGNHLIVKPALALASYEKKNKLMEGKTLRIAGLPKGMGEEQFGCSLENIRVDVVSIILKLSVESVISNNIIFTC